MTKFKMPYVIKHKNGTYEVFNGKTLVIMNKTAYKAYNEMLKNIGKKYIT